MKKGIVTEAVPEDCWLWPYIEYEIEFDDDVIVVDRSEYQNENYEKRGYIKEKNLWDSFFEDQQTRPQWKPQPITKS